MIDIKDKHTCCGCSACVQACPKQCISFEEDEKGFRYPLVNEMLCIDCGICQNVCPFINQNNPKEPLNVYAAINQNDEVRTKSSSGGIFSMLAEAIIDEGGVVFAARFDETWEVIHDFTETKEGIESFRGSKYIQSRIGETYKQAKGFLEQNRKVLFSGTSCQIAGLNHFLRKKYENLLTIDVVCHGVPSPLVWREYLKEIIKPSNCSSINSKKSITSISFRDKTYGWKRPSFIIYGNQSTADVARSSNKDKAFLLFNETLDKNLFIQLFQKNLDLRPSCYKCMAKSGKSESDITLSDFWGISEVNAEYDDDKGTSGVLINTDKGEELFGSLNCLTLQVTYNQFVMNNPLIEKSVKHSKNSDKFWNTFFSGGIMECQDFLKKIEPSNFIKHVYGLRERIFKLLNK